MFRFVTGRCQSPPDLLNYKSKTKENTLNLNELNTVSDLLAANSQPEPTPETVSAESVKELLFKLDAPEALELLKETVAQLAHWHQLNAAEAAEEGDGQKSAAWAVDEGRLHVALLALNEVSF